MSYKLVDDERMQENVDLTKAYVSENAYLKDDTTETALADNDYIPFYDTSASSKKKSLWSNIKSVLKTYFDGIYLTSHQDISGKADKVTSATANNLAALDSNGNLTDSGKSKSATIPSGGTTGQVLKKKSGTNYDTEWGALATSKGSATKGVYFDANGAVQEMSYTVGKSVPSNAVFTDTKVTQTNTTDSAYYRVLLSENANDTTQTVGARKSANLKFNPSTGNLQTQKINGVAVGSSPKFTDSGHTILNGSGSAMNQRGKLQFVGATVSDDPPNDATVVMTPSTISSYKASPTTTEVYDAAYINNLAGCEAVQITTSGWSPGTTSIAGKSCYYKSITLSKAVYGIPEVKLKPANGVPTASEESLFNCLDYYGVDSASPNTLKVYAITKPTSSFYIWVIRNGGRV